MRIVNDVIIIEHPDDWTHEMLAGAIADPVAERTAERGVVRVRCRINDTLPDARIVVEAACSGSLKLCVTGLNLKTTIRRCWTLRFLGKRQTFWAACSF